MAVYARGYRPYTGGFKGSPAWLIIQKTTSGLLYKTLSFRILIGLFALLFLGSAIQLYVFVGVEEQLAAARLRMGEAMTFEEMSARYLRVTITSFYSATSVLGALLAMFAGAGLVADDLRHRAMALYLVRPIRPFDYALGKALVVPRLLLYSYLVPGLLLILLTALWQPEVGVMEFLGNHTEFISDVVMLWLIAALGYGGLMLMLSSRSSGRGATIAMAAGVFFGGTIIQGLGRRLEGVLGDVMRHCGLILNSWGILVPGMFNPMRPVPEARLARRLEQFASPAAGLVVAACVFALGFYVVHRRAQSAEISE